MIYYFLGVLALLVIVPTALWGFPGVWVLLALVPSFIIATTIAHVRRPKNEPGATIRPGVLVLGSLFGLGTGAVSLMFMWAANAPSTIVVESERVIEAPVARIWSEVSNPYQRTKWDNWVIDLEMVGDDELIVGSKYRTKLNLERHQPYAQQTVLELVENKRIAWQIDPIGGAQLEHFIQTMELEPQGETKTLVRYKLSYQVDGVVARVAERIAMRGSAERMTSETLEKLNRVISGME